MYLLPGPQPVWSQHWGGLAWQGWHRLGQAYLSLGCSPEVDLTELHGLLQRSLLIHLSKEMPAVRGPRPWWLASSRSLACPGSVAVKSPPTVGPLGPQPCPGSMDRGTSISRAHPQGHSSGPVWPCQVHLCGHVISSSGAEAGRIGACLKWARCQAFWNPRSGVEGRSDWPGDQGPRHGR